MTTNANLRHSLMLSSAILLVPMAAAAQSGHVAPTSPEPHNGYVAPVAPVPHSGQVVPVAPEPQILIANPNTPTTARDPVNITGIGQMIIDNGGGSVGLCTGSLINPRTVLFAAHCVNTRSAIAYGAGGTRIGFGFEASLRAEAAGRPDELIQWLLAGPNQYRTNIGSSFFNVDQVRYNPLSLEPAARGFLYGDVATATLDTPAAGIPTWAMLFSPLAPTTITAAGTGYNVGIAGYGGNGTGTSGTGAIDFRRRIADNIVGALTSLQTFEGFLFGGAPNGLTQNLYFIDFDDPLRGTAGASRFDFNAFRDNARGTTEGTTAGGDSGGPLILQNAQNLNLAIGVLSGGYTRFFGGQSSNGYGTVSFYQPLYLYWDWIAANNPYRYVSNVAGDRAWTDPTNWVTTLDPNYQIIGPTGQIINGLPNDPGQQKNGTSGQFGEICFQNAVVSDCLNVATGVNRIDTRPIGTGDGSDVGVATNAPGEAIIKPVSGYAEAQVEVSGEATAQAGGTIGLAALPAATLANGLPGATGFTPNNVAPDRLTGSIGRYFDVNLSAQGTTTLSSTATVDRFRITGANSRLNIATGGSLTSLMDVNQMTGTLSVDGNLTSRGDYMILSGLLSGNGRIAAPFVTNVMGTITPGTLGGVGALGIDGNLVLSSGSRLVIDIATTGADRLSVAAGSGQAGTALLGGTLTLNAIGRPSYGASYTVLSAAGGVTGQFSTLNTQLTPILYGTVSYTSSSVGVRIDALNYATLSGVRRGELFTGRLLDANRAANYAALAGIYDQTDIQNLAGIRSTLNQLAPHVAQAKRSQAVLVNEVLADFTSDRMHKGARHDLAGTLTIGGNPAAMSLNGEFDRQSLMTQLQSAAGPVRRMTLPDDVGAYIHAGYFEGDSRPTFGGDKRDTLDGWFGVAGVELYPETGWMLGANLAYASSDGSATPLQKTGSDTFRGAIYATREVGDGFMMSVGGNISTTSLDTERLVTLGTSTQTLTSSEDVFSFGGEASISKEYENGGVFMTPQASLRATTTDFDDVRETGGSAALDIGSGRYNSLQGRVGIDFALPFNTHGYAIAPHSSVRLVHEYSDGDAPFVVGFAGVGNRLRVPRATGENSWFELGGGLSVTRGDMRLDISADTTTERDDINYQTYRAALSWRF